MRIFYYTKPIRTTTNKITESMDNIKLAQPTIDLILFLRALTAIIIGMMSRYQKIYPVNNRISHITTIMAIAIKNWKIYQRRP